MKSRIIPALAVALLALSACNNANDKGETVSLTAPDPLAAELANRAPVELPPAMKAESTMRCKDNSLVYVTFFEGDKQAVVQMTKGGAPVTLRAANAGEPLTADGFSLTGNPSTIELTAPGKGKMACHK